MACCAVLVVGASAQRGASQSILRLATTTSTADTGLLGTLLPDFERQCQCRVDVVAVGTGQALELGRRGDVDVLLVHAREAEDAFVADGQSARRDEVMYNDFVLVGPVKDPAGVAASKLAVDAFKAIATAKAPFASRGDQSGTHTKERAIWKTARLSPTSQMAWYLSVGQGMGETLTFANERQAYALSDRATWLAMKARLPGLTLLFGGATPAANSDRDLRNEYGVLAVSAAKHPTVNAVLAARFVEWILSRPTQERIGSFGVDRFGQQLFFPDSDELKATGSLRVQVGTATRTFTIAGLKAMPRATLPDHEVIGVRRGRLGRITWTGASLRDVLLAVDSAIASPARSAARVVLSSSDGYTVLVKWSELFGRVSDGERVYLAKGCNECHGADAEGTAPAGMRPAPPLTGLGLPAPELAAVIRDPVRHAGISIFTTANLTDPDVAAMLEWFRNPKGVAAVAPAGASAPAPIVVLAYERDGKPMRGRDGLLQLVVGSDEFASRYSHWVSSITVR